VGKISQSIQHISWGSITLLMVFYGFLEPFFYNTFYFHFSVKNQQKRFNLFGDLDNNQSIFEAFSIFSKAVLNPMTLLPLLALSLVAFLLRKTTWQTFENAKILRGSVLLIAAYITWWNVTLSFNHYFESWYFLDRFVLIILLISLWFSPVFIFLFVPLNFLFFAQLLYPIGIVSGLHYFVLFDGSILFLCLVLTQKIISKIPQWQKGKEESLTFQYFLTAYCLLTTSYFYSGVKKVLESPKGFNWVFENEQYVDFQFFMKQGWLYFLSPSAQNQLIDTARALNPFILGIVLLAQLGVIFSFVHRTFFRLVMCALISFHVGFFLLDGCSFLEWIVLDLVFLYIFSIQKNYQKNAFNRNTLMTSIYIYILGFFLFTPPKLSWFESHIRRIYRFEVENTEGVRFMVSPNDLGFGNAVFAGLNIAHLFDKKTLTVTSYSSKYEGMKTIKNVSAVALDSLTELKGENPFDAHLKTLTERYIKHYFKHKDKQYAWLNGISPVGHYLSMRWHKDKIHPTQIDNPKAFIITAKECFINSNYEWIQRDSIAVVFDLK
jgi:hypothetical protein